MNFYQTLCCLLLTPYSVENSQAEKLEIDTARGFQGPAQPWLSHRVAISTKQQRADPFKQIGPSHETGSQFIQKLYISENNLGQNTMHGAGMENMPTIFPES